MHPPSNATNANVMIVPRMALDLEQVLLLPSFRGCAKRRTRNLLSRHTKADSGFCPHEAADSSGMTTTVVAVPGSRFPIPDSQLHRTGTSYCTVGVGSGVSE